MRVFTNCTLGFKPQTCKEKGSLGNKELAILYHSKHSNRYEHRHFFNNIDIVIQMATCQQQEFWHSHLVLFSLVLKCTLFYHREFHSFDSSPPAHLLLYNILFLFFLWHFPQHLKTPMVSLDPFLCFYQVHYRKKEVKLSPPRETFTI